MVERGKYIVVEGGEGAGKSTQVALFSEWLTEKGIDNVPTKEPGAGKLNAEIRKFLLDKENTGLTSTAELFIYSTDRTMHYEPVVIPTLENGKWVVSDRSWPSTFAYQGTAGGADMDDVRTLTRIATHGIMPDLLYILDVDYKVGLARERNPNRISEKELEYHQRVRKGYLDLAEEFSDFTVVIPDGLKIEQVQTEMRRIACDRFGI